MNIIQRFPIDFISLDPLKPEMIMTTFGLLPVGGVVCNEGVGHHDEGEVAARDVLYGHDCGQPDPPTPLSQKYRVEKIEHSSEDLPSHTDSQEGLPEIISMLENSMSCYYTFQNNHSNFQYRKKAVWVLCAQSRR